MENLKPRVGTSEGRLKQLDKKIELANEKIENHRQELEGMQNTKVDITDDKHNRRALKKQMMEIEEEHGVLTNT